MKREAVRSICEMLLSHDTSVTEITKEVLSERLTKLVASLNNDEQEIALDILLSGTCQNEDVKKGEVYWSDYGHLYVVVERGWGFKRSTLKRYRREKNTAGPEGVVMSRKNNDNFFNAENSSVIYYDGEENWKAPCYTKLGEIQFVKEPSYEQLKTLFKEVMPDVEF